MSGPFPPIEPVSDPHAASRLQATAARVGQLRRRRRTLAALSCAAVAAAIAVPLSVAGGSGHARSVELVNPPATTAPSTTSPTTSPSALTTLPPTTPEPPARSAPLQPVATVPLQTAHGGEFFSPSYNISCEIDYQQSGVSNGAYCETLAPPRSIEISTTGSVIRSCDGPQCLSNAGVGTPTLPYGSATGLGPLRCLSLTSGMICTGSGTGFMISRAGITACSGSASVGTLTVCPGSGPVGATVTIAGWGCDAGFLVFLGPGAYVGSGGGGADVGIAPGAFNDFAGTWTIPSTYYTGGDVNTRLPVKPGSDYQFETSANACHAPFGVTGGSG